MPYDPDEESVFRAGQLVPAGVYARLDSAPERRVVLGKNGALPASFDGRVALYHQIGDGRLHRLPSRRRAPTGPPTGAPPRRPERAPARQRLARPPAVTGRSPAAPTGEPSDIRANP